jgi:hypothetical protein
MTSFARLAPEQQLDAICIEFTSHLEEWLQAPWRKAGKRLALQYGKTKITIARAEVSGEQPADSYFITLGTEQGTTKLSVDPAFVELQGSLPKITYQAEVYDAIKVLWAEKAMPKPYDHFDL